MTIAAPNRPLVITVHGIRTHAQWQRRLADHLQDAGFRASVPSYGWLWIFGLLSKSGRENKIAWFLLEYDRLTKGGTAEPPSVIAHSMGTYIVATAMERFERIRFNRVIFCGSIVRRDYSWTRRRQAGQIQKVLNDCGRRDLWVGLVEWWVKLSGPSGRAGFSDLAEGCVSNEVHEFRHSDYFTEENYTKRWIPFLRGEDRKPLTVEPKPALNWKYWLRRAIQTTVLLAIFVVLAPVLQTFFRCHDWPWDAAPSLPAEFPQVDESMLPTKADVLAEPKVRPSQVRLRVENETGRNLSMLMYACEQFYEPKRHSTGWRQINLKRGQSEPINEFSRRHGWHLFFAKAKCDNEPLLIDRFNVFTGKYPILRIRQSDSGSGFTAELEFGPE